MSILLLSSKKIDVHVETVAALLSERGNDVRCFYLDEIPYKLHAGAFINGKGFDAYLEQGEISCRISDVTTVWNRSRAFRHPLMPESLGAERYIRDETRLFLESLSCLMPNAFWLGHPDCLREADSKLRQLQLAVTLGFRIPPTAFGNSRRAAENLLDCPGPYVIKPIDRKEVEYPLNLKHRLRRFFYEWRNQKILADTAEHDPNLYERMRYKVTQPIPTQRFEDSEASDYLARVSACPVIMQTYIPKAFELRVTVVGNRVFPCAIYSQDAPTEQGKVDWRGFEDDVRHEVYALPSEVEQRCLRMVNALGLNFGCLDLLVTPEEEYVFLEINHSGAWLWVEEKTGLPIAEAIADLLCTNAYPPKIPLLELGIACPI